MTSTKQTSYVGTAAKISGVLLLICAVVAGVVSLVYSLTIDAYTANLEAEINRSLAGIFDAAGEEDFTSSVATETDEYTVYSTSKGYCVKLDANGFGGAASLMVGYNGDGTIRGVSVVSHAETPGIGSKATEAAHLSQYQGRSGVLTISKSGNDDINAISGATISSKAIHAAINRANEIMASLTVND